MEFRVSHPQYLIAAAATIPLVLLAIRFFSSMTMLRRLSAVLLRASLMLLIGLLLAGLATIRTTDRFAVIYAIDVSGSVKRPAASLTGIDQAALGLPDGSALDAVRRFIDLSSATRGPDDLVGVVVFAGQAVAAVTPTGAKRIDWPAEVALPDGTNIEAALKLARALMPPDAAGRIVLVSDGVATAGDARGGARQAAGQREGRGRTGVSVLPIEYALKSETYLESVDAPPRAIAGSTVSVRVVLASTDGGTGTLRLLDEGRPIDLNGDQPGAGRRVTLAAPRSVFVLEVPLDKARVHRFRAIYEPDPLPGPGGRPALSGDTLAQNNSSETFTLTPGAGAVLLVDGVNGGKGTTLASTLRDSGLAVDVVTPEAMPGDLLSLQPYDLIVFENVPADAVAPGAQTAVASHVRDLGGGFLMVGGPDSFGAGGWRGSEIEPILPVGLELPDKLVVPEVAMIFVMDNSGSMGWHVMGSMRSQEDIANESAAQAIKSLDKADLVGVITFNDSYSTLIPLGPNSDPEASMAKVRTIYPNGGTNAGPALVEAGRQLDRVTAKSKHIILLSDGRSAAAETLPGIASELYDRGIRVSAISIGDQADPETMTAIARQGAGEHYHTINPMNLPRVLIKAVRVVRSPMVRESPFTPRVAQDGSPLLAGVGELPRLGGLVLTRARTEPTITTALVDDDGEPVLAHWQYELGRVGAFTSDASKWARDWIQTPGYRAFWTQAARVLARTDSGAGSGVESRSEIIDGVLHVRLDATTPTEGGGRAPVEGIEASAVVYSPSGRVVTVPMTQIGPGLYEARTPADEAGTYVSLVKPSRGGARISPVLSGASGVGGVEYRQLRSDRALLEQIAADTGGAVLSLDAPGAVNLFDRGGVKPVEALAPAWRWLLPWTLAVLLLDIATRRIAWDRWVSDQYGDGLRSRAAVAVEDRGGRAAATLAALRGRDEPAAEPGYTPPVLGERDAQRLAVAARDRRRKVGMAPHREAPQATREDAPEPPGAEPGLLAAKRRARERFEDR